MQDGVAARVANFQEQPIRTEFGMWRRLDCDPDLNHLRLIRAEHSVGRIDERELQARSCCPNCGVGRCGRVAGRFNG
jgi:hypothetical protein